MAASNTKDCFRECIWRTVVGVLFDSLPPNRLDLSAGTKTLVFDDHTGLTIATNGAHWLESAEEIHRAIALVRADLESRKRDIEEVLMTAGALKQLRSS